MSDYVEAKLVTGGPRQFPNGQIVQPGETVVVTRGEAETSSHYEIVGPATEQDHFEQTGMVRPQTEAPEAPGADLPAAPHPRYDSLTADQVIDVIGKLEDAEDKTAIVAVGEILEYENATKKRKTVIEAAKARITALTEGDS